MIKSLWFPLSDMVRFLKKPIRRRVFVNIHLNILHAPIADFLLQPYQQSKLLFVFGYSNNFIIKIMASKPQ